MDEKVNKPVYLLGAGARAGMDWILANAERYHVPILTTWQGIDLIPEDHPCFCGRPGVFGQRAANIIQQKATHVFCFGARMDGEQVAYDYDRFAPNAKKFVYDIDEAELKKFPFEWERFQHDLTSPAEIMWYQNAIEWRDWCKTLYNRFRPELDGQPSEGIYQDTFYIIRKLSECARNDDMLAIGSSSGAVNAFLQAFKVKRGQRVTLCATIGAMGADIPMAVGVALASGKRVITITGDGGFSLNAGALATVSQLQLPINFIVCNNDGYNSIRVMQDMRFDGRHVGADPRSGLELPSIQRLAWAYDISYHRPHPNDIGAIIDSSNAPKILEVFADPKWKQLPRVMASTVNGQLRTDDMQDMTPKLDTDELREIMEA